MRAARRPTILVGVSGSPASVAALRWAEAEAQRRHGQLRIVLTWQPEHRAAYARMPTTAGNPAGPDRARRVLAGAMRAGLGPGPQPDTTAEVVEDSAERALIAGSADADLLVLGAGPGVSIGPVVRTCLGQALCPVVVVGMKSRPGGQRGPQPPQRDDDLTGDPAEHARRATPLVWT